MGMPAMKASNFIMREFTESKTAALSNLIMESLLLDMELMKKLEKPIGLSRIAGSPTILDKPIGFSSFFINSISNSKDSMIKLLRAAVLLSVNSLIIKLEAFMAGINSNTARTLGCNGRFKSIFISSLNINESDISCSSVFWTVATLVILTLIGITLFSVNTSVILDILESI